MLEVKIPLSLSRWVVVWASAPLTEADWQRFLACLDFMKPGLVAPAIPTALAAPEPGAGGV